MRRDPLDLFHRRIVAALAVGLLIQAVGPAPARSEDWAMAFNISVSDPDTDSGRLRNHLEAGVLTSGTDGYDNNSDVVALLAGPLQAAFTHEGDAAYPPHLQTLWRDVRTAGVPKSWTIRVASQQSGLPVTVEWTPPPAVSADTCHRGIVLLQDQASGQSIDLNTTSSYVYTSTGTPGSPEVRYFTLTVSQIPQGAPAVPTGLDIHRQGPFVRLQWNQNSAAGVAGYHIWRGRIKGGPYARITTTPTHKNWYMNKTTAMGMATYYYVVTAMGTNGCESGFSKETATTAGKKPSRK